MKFLPGALPWDRQRSRRAGDFLGVFVLALVVRLVYLWQARDLPTMQVPLSDARSYFEWSGRIAAGDWWRGQVFFQAPLYPYALALVRLLGGNPLAHILVAQAILGALSCVLLAAAGSWLMDRRTGLVGGVLLALYAPAIFFDGLVQKTVLDTVFLAGLLACLAAAQRTPRSRTWFGAGLLLGLLSLTRENALLLVVTLPAWIALRFRDRPLAWRAGRIAAFALGIVLALAPVTARNYAVGGGLVVTTYQLGVNLYIGNNPGADGHYRPLRPGREDPAFESTDAVELAEAARGRHLAPREVSDYWVQRSLEFVRRQPAHWLGLTARKALLLLSSTEIIDVEDFYTHTRYSSLLRALGWLANFGVVFPLAAAGIWLTWRERSKLWVLHLVVVTLFAALLPFFVFGRYRFPLVLPLLLFAAAAVVKAADHVRKRRLRPLAAPAAAALVCGGIAWLPLVSRANQEAAASVNEGVAAAQLGRLDEALACQERAIRIAPGLLQAHYQRAAILQMQGQPEAAKVEYERVLALDPANEAALIDLGQLLDAEKRPAEACARFEEFLRRNPDRVIVRTSLAMSLGRLGRLAEARQQCERAIALEPGNGASHALLGQMLLAAKDTTRAIDALRRAIELSPLMPRAHVDLAAALQARLAGRPGRLAEAESHLRRAIALQPATPGAYELLARTLVARGEGRSVPAVLDSARRAGQASGDLFFCAGRDLRQAGDVPTAIAVLEAGARAYPGDSNVVNALAWYLATAPGEGPRSAGRALALAQQAVRITGGNWPHALDTEAAALAAGGQYARAAEVASAAATLARRRSDRALGAEFEERARLYRSGRPFVER